MQQNLVRRWRVLCLPFVAILAFLALPAAASAATGSISGTVSGPGGTGVGDVGVEVYDAGTVTQSAVTIDHTGATASTPLGSYTVTGLAPGVYFVDFTTGSATNSTGAAENVASQWYGAPGGTAGLSQSNAAEVTVTSGGNTPINQTLAAGATITGMVMNGANPVGGSVAPIGVSGGGLPGTPFPATGTGAGQYTITGVPAGTYYLSFSPSNTSWAAGYYSSAGPLVNTTSEASSVTVAAGGTATANVQAQTPASIAGTVTQGGSPIGDVDVSAYDSSDQDVQDTTTASDGTYSLNGLLPGTYKVVFEADQTNLAYQWYGGTNSFTSATAVPAAAGQNVTGINAALVVGGAVIGKVTNTAGTPLQGVDVVLEDANGTPLNDSVTASDGTYTIYNMPAGSYYVEFNPTQVPGSTSYQVQYYGGKQVLSGSTPVAVTAGQSTTNISAVMLPASTAGQVTTVTQTVAAPIPTDTGTAAVSGDVKVGHKLSAKVGGWQAGSSYTYQWYANGKAIKGATGSTYTVTGGYYRHTIQVVVTGQKSGFNWASVTSAATAKVAEGSLSTKTPKISGTAKAGSTLKVTVGTWTKGTKFAYQWYAGKKAIRGATKSSLKLARSVAGSAITVKVTGRLTGYKSVAKVSHATGKVAA